jgi:hypothetical protein
MAFRRTGWSDNLTSSRLAWLSGTPYPALPRQVALALLGFVPAAESSDRFDVAALVRMPVSYGPPQMDSSRVGFPQDWYCEPTQDVTFAIPGNPAVQAHHDFQAWALLDEYDVVLYIGVKQTMAALGKPLTLSKATFRVTAESPS